MTSQKNSITIENEILQKDTEIEISDEIIPNNEIDHFLKNKPKIPRINTYDYHNKVKINGSK